MKKVMIVLIAALSFVACNNNAQTEVATNDSTAVSADSTAVVDSTAVDTTTVK